MPERTDTISRNRGPAAGADPDAVLLRPARDQAHKMGRALVSQFYMLAKTAGMFDFENVITRDAVLAFLGTLTECFEGEDTIQLMIASDCLFVNESRLKIDFEGFTSFKYVIESFKQREIGSILFRRDLDEDMARAFLRLFIENDEKVEDPRKRIIEGLRDAGITAIQVEAARDLSDEVISTDPTEGHREASINTYFKSIFVAKQFIESFSGARSGSLKRAKRLVHSIVDLVAQDESTLLALTQIKNFDHYLFTHCANVCVLAVSVGQQLGLEKSLLANLGLAALLHDVGLTEMPHDLLVGKEAISREEMRVYEQHPAIGARAILRTQGLSEASIRCLLVAFEHHLREDGSGFPARLGNNRETTLLGRIVGVVDFYDAVTTPDLDESPSFTPEEALRLMANEGRDVFDSALVKMLVNTLGTFPLGTMVRLDTGEVGVVHKKNSHFSQHSRPIVKLIADQYGMPVPPRIVDLNEYDRENERFRRTIVETVSSSLYFDGAREFTDFV